MTAAQKQCLLKYLGYYRGPVDGIWGAGSQNAAREFRAAWGVDMEEGEDEEDALRRAVGDGDFWAGIRYFRRQEFACKCGKYCGGFPTEMDPAAVRLADCARAHFGSPATVVSGLRCQRHNANVGGVANSRHLTGKAIDLRISGVSAAELLAYLEQTGGVRYAYAINGTNVHLDVE